MKPQPNPMKPQPNPQDTPHIHSNVTPQMAMIGVPLAGALIGGLIGGGKGAVVGGVGTVVAGLVFLEAISDWKLFGGWFGK